MTPLATITDYDGLIDALKVRKAAVGLTDEALEELTGLARGHVGKLFGIKQTKKLGPVSLGLLLQGLAVQIVLVEDVEATARMRTRWQERERPVVMLTAASMPRNRTIITRKNARKMVQLRVSKHSKKRRSSIARKNAQVRWSKAKMRDPLALARVNRARAAAQARWSKTRLVAEGSGQG